MSQNYRVLAINPGSTSTKIGVFEGEKLVYEGVVRHTAEEIAAWGGVIAQAPMRMKLIKDLLAKENIDLATMDAFVGRGGIVRPLKSGVYTINEKLLDDLYHLPSASRHASALGGIFAHELGEEYGKPCFIADPVVVDERNDIARVTGLPSTLRQLQGNTARSIKKITTTRTLSLHIWAAASVLRRLKRVLLLTLTMQSQVKARSAPNAQVQFL